MTDLATSMRTHDCGVLREAHVGEAVTLCGWVAHRRDHGGITFIDLRDREGVVQVVFHPTETPDAHEAAQRLGAEDVVRVAGEVRARPDGMRNPNLASGGVEVAAATLEVLAEAETPPFLIEDRADPNEMLRLEYRYLDLRRPEMVRRLRLRHDAARITRQHLHDRGFLEIETPAFTRSTPEGARDFLVPARLTRGSFYALPQSPQQLKQLLMVAGQDRYYQLARCFRDEAHRADRQFEFTQLDIEMSFVDQEDVLGEMEPLFQRLLSELHGVDVTAPFPRLAFDDAIERFGSDKPDLRYPLELVDLAVAFEGTSFNAFASVLSSGGRIKAIRAPGAGQLSRKELDLLVQDVKGRGAAGLVWVAVEEGGSVRSPVEKHLSPGEVIAVLEGTGAGPGDLILIVADRADRVAVALDGLRRSMAVRLGLVPANEWSFAWIVDPPLFEWSHEQGGWTSAHHPFTAPATDDLAPETAKAKAYDLTLNGWELSTGSIRIHDPAVQRRVFQTLGLSDAEIDEKFGHLLRAFRFGVPPHGGIAFGWDRIVALLAGVDAITEVIAFPKTQSGFDPLTGAPAPVSDEQLDELGIRIVEPAQDDGAERA